MGVVMARYRVTVLVTGMEPESFEGEGLDVSVKDGALYLGTPEHDPCGGFSPGTWVFFRREALEDGSSDD